MKSGRKIPSLAQWKELPRFMSTGEKRLVSIALLIALTTSISAVLHEGSQKISWTPAAGGSYTEGLAGTPHLVNPLYASLNDVDADLTRLVFSGLMAYEPGVGVVPDIAESVSVSEDGKIYTTTIRQDATWHDGEPITANDVYFTVTAAQNPAYNSPLITQFTGVTVEATADRVVTFTLPEPRADFLNALTSGLLPAHLWSDIPAQNATRVALNLKPVGNGPYMFEKITTDSKGNIRAITLKRNPNAVKETNISNLTFKFFFDSSELADALRNRNIEGAAGLEQLESLKFQNDKNVTLINVPTSRYVAAFINLKTTSALKELDVRKALTLATDRTALVTQAKDGQATAHASIILPGMFDQAANPGVANPAQAATTLELAGWKMGDNGVRSKDSVELVLNLVTIDDPELLRVAQTLKEQWSPLGVTVNITPIAPSRLQPDILASRSFDLLLATTSYGATPNPYLYWHSSQGAYPGLNIAQFSDPEADAALDALKTATTPEETKAQWEVIMQNIEEQAAAIILYQPTFTYALSASINGENIPSIIMPSDRFADIESWYARTKPRLKLR